MVSHQAVRQQPESADFFALLQDLEKLQIVFLVLKDLLLIDPSQHIEELDQHRENPVSDKTAWWQEGTAKLLQELKKGQESGEPIPEEDVSS